MQECTVINCHDRATREGLCSPHYNDDVEAKQPKSLTPAQKKKAMDLAKELDETFINDIVDLGWWLQTYGEVAHPAKYMNRDFHLFITWDEEKCGPIDPYYKDVAKLSRSESLMLNDRLKELHGTPVSNTHIWMFLGRKHYEREGPQNLYACVPVDAPLGHTY